MPRKTKSEQTSRDTKRVSRSVPPDPGFEKKDSRVGSVLMMLLMTGTAVYFADLIVVPQVAGTAGSRIQSVLKGLGGDLALLIPAFFTWLAYISTVKRTERANPPVVTLCDGLLLYCIFIHAQILFAENVIREINIQTFANFVSRSFALQRGGGGLGAVFAWWLYRMLGKGGGILTVSVIMAMLLVISGRAAAFARFALRCRDGCYRYIIERRERISERRAAREEERRRETEEREETDAYTPEYGEANLSEPPLSPVLPKERRKKTVKTYETEPEALNPMPKTSSVRSKGRSTLNLDPASFTYTGSQGVTKAGPIRSVYVEDDEPVGENLMVGLIDDKKKRKKMKLQPVGDETPGTLFRQERPEALKNAPVNNPPERTAGRFEEENDADEIVFERPIDKNGSGKDAKETPTRALSGEDLTIKPDESEVFEPDPVTRPPSSSSATQNPSKLPKPSEALEEEDIYYYPPIDLLTEGSVVQGDYEGRDREKAALLEETLKDFGISTRLVGVAHGPAVTRFELQPARGVKVSRVTNLSDDIAMRLAAMSIRIEAPIPGKDAVGIEIPNDEIEMVHLRDVLLSKKSVEMASKIAVGLGKDNAGRYIMADIAKMPHVLIAGQTGSGKSVCINSIIVSILYRATPDEVRLILIDPKVVELSIYNGIPHLVCPVVTDPKKAASALDWAVQEMERRYNMFSTAGVRDIKGYNKSLPKGEKPMPQMVIIIDELADLMMVASSEVQESICRIAQLARACGMHLVIATQRPSVNVITGIIKANIPTRIAFSVASQVDSRTMIDHGGAEKLLGNGDMLFVPPGINKAMRIQGAWVSDEEVHAIVNYIKKYSDTTYDEDMIEKMNNATRSDAEKEEASKEYDPRLPEAVEVVLEAQQASVSMLQRRMRVGYARAGRLIDEMEIRGIVGPADSSKKYRDVLVGFEEYRQMFAGDEKEEE